MTVHRNKKPYAWRVFKPLVCPGCGGDGFIYASTGDKLPCDIPACDEGRIYLEKTGFLPRRAS